MSKRTEDEIGQIIGSFLEWHPALRDVPFSHRESHSGNVMLFAPGSGEYNPDIVIDVNGNVLASSTRYGYLSPQQRKPGKRESKRQRMLEYDGFGEEHIASIETSARDRHDGIWAHVTGAHVKVTGEHGYSVVHVSFDVDGEALLVPAELDKPRTAYSKDATADLITRSIFNEARHFAHPTELGRADAVSRCRETLLSYLREKGLLGTRCRHMSDASLDILLGADEADVMRALPFGGRGMADGAMRERTKEDCASPIGRYRYLCAFGGAEVLYDPLGRVAAISPGTRSAIDDYARLTRHGDDMAYVIGRFGESFDRGNLGFSYDEGTEALTVDVTLRESFRLTLDLTKGYRERTKRFIADVMDADAHYADRLARRWSDDGLTGDILLTAVASCVMANSAQASYITRTNLPKIVRGLKVTLYKGAAECRYNGTMGPLTNADVDAAIDRLIDYGVLRTEREYGGRNIEYYDSIRATDMTGAFVEASEAQRDEGADAPADEMTEMELLASAEPTGTDRDIEVAMALLDHPACYGLEPGRFVAFISGTPGALDYARMAYSLETDRRRRRFLKEVLAAADPGD